MVYLCTIVFLITGFTYGRLFWYRIDIELQS